MLPNFVVIYADDLGYGDLGCYGSDLVKTPHLDHLAAQGVRFTQWYSSSPVCSPSRAGLLTGRYPTRAGITQIIRGKRSGIPGLPPSELTLARALKPLGYQTALCGKWHLGSNPENHPNAHGFDYFFGFIAGAIDYYSHLFYYGEANGVNPFHDLWENRREVWWNGRYLTELITERAVDFIKQTEKPFFLYVPYNAPHWPMHAPKDYLDRYPGVSADRRIMAAMISAMDDGVGQLIEALKQNGQFENTFIFFSSDNGPSIEQRNWLDGTEDLYYGGSAGIFRGHKYSLYEGGLREPAIMCYPTRIAPGQLCTTPAIMLDIFPTVLKLAGGQLPLERELDGQDVLPMLKVAEARSLERRLFWEYNGQLAVRQGKWKLVLNGKLDFQRPGPDPVHLADLEIDPGEQHNLKEQYPQIVEQLKEEVEQWYSKVRQENFKTGH